MRIVIFIVLGLIAGLLTEVRQITGIVINGDVPLPGVTIRVVGGTESTTTDIDGRFLLTVKEQDELEFTHLRMSPLRLKLRKGAD